MWTAVILAVCAIGAAVVAERRGYRVAATAGHLLQSLIASIRECCSSRSKPDTATSSSKRTASNAHDDLETGKLLSSSEWGEDRPAKPLNFTNLPGGYNTLLSAQEAGLLAKHLPSKCQGAAWSLLYSTRLHGYSLHALISHLKHQGPTLTVIMDDQGHVFGGFASVDWAAGGTTGTGPAIPAGSTPGMLSRKGAVGLVGEHWARGSVGYVGSPGSLRANSGYFGDHDCFLFKARPGAMQVHKWTRRNQLFLLCREELIAWGGGGGAGYGLSLDADLERGSSAPCETYGPMSASLASDYAFKVVQVECWGFAGAPHVAVMSATQARAQLGALRSQVSAAARDLLKGPPLGGSRSSTPPIADRGRGQV